jgi:hypothetical protein
MSTSPTSSLSSSANSSAFSSTSSAVSSNNYALPRPALVIPNDDSSTLSTALYQNNYLLEPTTASIRSNQRKHSQSPTHYNESKKLKSIDYNNCHFLNKSNESKQSNNKNVLDLSMKIAIPNSPINSPSPISSPCTSSSSISPNHSNLSTSL